MVVIQFGSIKIDIPALFIGISFFQKDGYHMDKLINAVGRRLYHIGTLDVQLPAVLEKRVGIELGNFHDRLVLSLGTL